MSLPSCQLILSFCWVHIVLNCRPVGQIINKVMHILETFWRPYFLNPFISDSIMVSVGKFQKFSKNFFVTTNIKLFAANFLKEHNFSVVLEELIETYLLKCVDQLFHTRHKRFCCRILRDFINFSFQFLLENRSNYTILLYST